MAAKPSSQWQRPAARRSPGRAPFFAPPTMVDTARRVLFCCPGFGCGEVPKSQSQGSAASHPRENYHDRR
jgi:hypothetical protein